MYSAYGNNASAVFGHFYNNGMSETRRANEEFYVVAYRNRYPDLQAAFGNNWNMKGFTAGYWKFVSRCALTGKTCGKERG